MTNAINRPTDFASWYSQIQGAADIDITSLMADFNAGVTPEEVNAR